MPAAQPSQTRLPAWLRTGLNAGGRLLSALFSGEPQPGLCWLPWVWIAVLYLLGVFLWGFFLSWGNFPYDFHDWAEISAPRLAFVQDAVRTGQLPLHMPDSSALRGVTDRFMVIPDVSLTPQMLLLGVMDMGVYVLANTLFLYTIGVLGLLWLRRRFALSPIAYALLFLLFNFNGHILAHTSVGHANWGGYFLFPWFVVLVLSLLDAETPARLGWRWAAGMAFLLFAVLLQGSFHHFVWCLMFLAFLGLFSWKHLGVLLKAVIASVLLGMVRLLPPALGLGLFDSDFLSGYATVTDVFTALVTLKEPLTAQAHPVTLHYLGWWEFDLYMGLVGAAFLLIFGLARWLKRRSAASGYPQLLLPIAAIFLLSLGQVYRVINELHLPTAERVSSRMLVLPVIFLLVMAAIQLQKWLEEVRPDWQVQLALLGLLAALFSDLWQYLRVWRVAAAADFFPRTPVNLALKVVANHPDAPYITLLAVGAGLTLVTAVVLLVLAARDRRAL